MHPPDVVAAWPATQVGSRQRWRVNLRYHPERAVISVHGDEQAAASELGRLIALVRGLGTAVIDLYLPEFRTSS